MVAALLEWRKEKASNLEAAYAKLVDRSVVRDLQHELDVLTGLVSEAWVQATQPAELPQLVDILSLEIAEAELRTPWEAMERVYDEKFHTLQAPQLLAVDLSYYRSGCSIRRRSVGLAFVDIDDFKRFNTQYGEGIVDIIVLPVFMRAVEATVFGRGLAYRQGGDEYVLCIPNVDASDIRLLFDRVRTTVSNLRYDGIEDATTVSIGYVLLAPNSPTTNAEALSKAAEAKQQAKDAGKNRIAGFEREPFTAASLKLMSS